MSAPRRRLPVWLLGLTNALFGMYGGVLVIAVPQLLSARHVSETTIAGLTAATISPGFWSFVASPVLDVRFSRRWYAMVTASLAAALLVVALLDIDNLTLVEACLVTGFFFANLYQSALGGWLSSIIESDEEHALSVWVTIANISGGGAMAMLAGEVIRGLPPVAAALSLGVIVLLPTLIFPFMPAPGPDRRLARESFPQFFREIVRLIQQREVLIAIALFLAPAATFSLVNMLAGVGEDFHASSRFVGWVGGAGVVVAGIAGCFIFPLIDKLLPLRFLFLSIGAVGALFTLLLLVMPHTPWTFAAALIGENVFQSIAITCSTAITFAVIGRDNPLAATTYCLLVSAFNVSNTYMLVVDGRAYTAHGVSGSYLTDAGLSLTACAVLSAVLFIRSPRSRLSRRPRDP